MIFKEVEKGPAGASYTEPETYQSPQPTQKTDKILGHPDSNKSAQIGYSAASGIQMTSGRGTDQVPLSGYPAAQDVGLLASQQQVFAQGPVSHGKENTGCETSFAVQPGYYAISDGAKNSGHDIPHTAQPAAYPGFEAGKTSSGQGIAYAGQTVATVAWPEYTGEGQQPRSGRPARSLSRGSSGMETFELQSWSIVESMSRAGS